MLTTAVPSEDVTTGDSDESSGGIVNRAPSGWPRISYRRRAALAAYYFGTYPSRAWRNHHRAVRGQLPIPVLLYHRVAEDADNPWSITNAAFRRQLDWLRSNVELISLAEAQRRLEHGESFQPSAVITFDDGYAENCDHALPLLIEWKVPCAYFVSTGHILEGRPFPHDVARGRPLPVNTVAELRRISDAGIEIAAHTRTHPNLGNLREPARLRDEIIDATKDLEDAVGKPIEYFAFPFGYPDNLTEEGLGLIREYGFRGFCSAYGGLNFPWSDHFHLKRFGPGESLLQVRNWVSGDPRMIRRTHGQPRWGQLLGHGDKPSDG
jgi:peptidoglycan/xylan/chitin deacetylase (PgdA/CDA1 family)